MRGRWNDLTGQVINGCKVIKLLDRRDKIGKYFWLVECHCGNLFETRGNTLSNGHAKSCGCLRGQNGLHKDLTGNVYNGLKIKQCSGVKNYNYMYLVECFCGTLFEARGTSIVHGHTKSCGCLKTIEYNNIKFHSMWEIYLSIYLTLKNIQWEYEKEIILDINGKKCKYYPDFYFPIENRYIEIKGSLYLDGLIKTNKAIFIGYQIEVFGAKDIESFIGISINKLSKSYAQGGFSVLEDYIKHNCVN